MSEHAPSNETATGRCEFGTSREEAERAQQLVLDAIARHDFDEAACFAIRLSLEEALTNAYKHGNKEDPAKKVTVEYEVGTGGITIGIEDEGEGFDPQTVPDPTAEENLEIPAGRGLMLMRAFMTEVVVEPPGNRVRMRYERR